MSEASVSSSQFSVRSSSSSESASPHSQQPKDTPIYLDTNESQLENLHNPNVNEAAAHWEIPSLAALLYFRSKCTPQTQRSVRNLWGCCIRWSSHTAQAFNELKQFSEVCYDPSDRYHVGILEHTLFLLTGKRLNEVSIQAAITFMTKGSSLSVSLEETLQHPGAMVNLLFLLHMEEILREEFHVLIAQIQSCEVGEVPLLPFLIQANTIFWNYLRRYRVKIDSEDAVLGIFELSVGWLKAWAVEYSHKDVHWDDYTWLREFLRQQAKALK